MLQADGREFFRSRKVKIPALNPTFKIAWISPARSQLAVFSAGETEVAICSSSGNKLLVLNSPIFNHKSKSIIRTLYLDYQIGNSLDQQCWVLAKGTQLHNVKLPDVSDHNRRFSKELTESS